MGGSDPYVGRGYTQLITVYTLFFFFCVITCSFLSPPLQAADGTRLAIVLEISGSINPAVSDYVRGGLKKAASANADLVILRMDTPGGLDRAMRDIVQQILASPLPVVGYVAPEGARAASAGTYILYASHIAAMSPATNLGAATPVSLGGFPDQQKPSKEKKEEQETETENTSTMKKKVINDSSAYIRALAERRGRNAEWAERAVRQGVSLSAEKALELGVIDIIAKDTNALLNQLNGRQAELDSGPHIISTENMVIKELKLTWRYKLLSVIGDPNVAYFLLLLGFFGLAYELVNPGIFLPGVAGGISLLLAFYAFQILPINYSGLALIIFGIALLISESLVPSFGTLGIGGLAAFIAGSLILIDDEGLKISLSVIVVTAIMAAILLLLGLGRLLAIRGKKILTGDEALIGMTGEAKDDFDGDGRIELLGESWLAESTDNIGKGDKVRVTSRDGLTLTVKSLTLTHGKQTEEVS